MIIFDFRFGPFDLLITRETVRAPFKVTREAPGEVTIDLPRVSLTFTNHRRVLQPDRS